MKNDDLHNLQRFLAAQDSDYGIAIAELKNGKKKSHWIWYVFPQVAGLGTSLMAEEYSIRSREEAEAYLEHPILGQRLHESCEALLRHSESRIEDIMGSPDDLKLRSSMTLFSIVSENPKIFQAVLDVFFNGQTDEKTMAFLESTP